MNQKEENLMLFMALYGMNENVSLMTKKVQRIIENRKSLYDSIEDKDPVKLFAAAEATIEVIVDVLNQFSSATVKLTNEVIGTYEARKKNGGE